MRKDSLTEAIEQITGAASPAALFGSPADPADVRRAPRLYRKLAWAAHPDRAGSRAGQAVDAMARLNRMHDEWLRQVGEMRGAHGQRREQGPYLEGSRGRYPLRARVDATATVATYATDRATVFADIARSQQGNPAAELAHDVRQALTAPGLAAFVPAVLDRGITDGRSWTVWALPESMATLRQVRAAYPAGLDGRDWAWMARRILMVLAEAPIAHGGVGVDTVSVQPEEHGVVITGWALFGTRRLADPWALNQRVPGPDPAVAACADLFAAMLAPSERRQLSFAASARGLDARGFLREYDALLGHLYGPRRFRPFTLPQPPR